MQYRNENTIKSDKRQIKGIKSIKICYVINNVYLIRPLGLWTYCPFRQNTRNKLIIFLIM